LKRCTQKEFSNGLVNELLGYLTPSSGPDQSVSAAEAALSRIARERASAQEKLATMAERRRQLLWNDADDRAIARLDAEADALHLTLERLELLEPRILDELSSSRDSLRKAEWRERLRLHVDAAHAFAAAHRAACDALENLIAADQDSRAAGFERELAAVTATVPRMIVREQGERFNFDSRRLADAEFARLAGRPPTHAAPPPAAPITASPAPPPAAKPIPAPPAVTPKPPRQQVRETAREGERLIKMLRTGIELSGRGQLVLGDIVSLPPAEAEVLVRNGSAEFEESPEVLM
jgi:hypothetical protein